MKRGSCRKCGHRLAGQARPRKQRRASGLEHTVATFDVRTFHLIYWDSTREKVTRALDLARLARAEKGRSTRDIVLALQAPEPLGNSAPLLQAAAAGSQNRHLTIKVKLVGGFGFEEEVDEAAPRNVVTLLAGSE